jgi:hypothetical protein
MSFAESSQPPAAPHCAGGGGVYQSFYKGTATIFASHKFATSCLRKRCHNRLNILHLFRQFVCLPMKFVTFFGNSKLMHIVIVSRPSRPNAKKVTLTLTFVTLTRARQLNLVPAVHTGPTLARSRMQLCVRGRGLYFVLMHLHSCILLTRQRWPNVYSRQTFIKLVLLVWVGVVGYMPTYA